MVGRPVIVYALPAICVRFMLVEGMFDELVEFLVKFPSAIVERRHVCVPRHGLEAAKAGVEPFILGEGGLNAERARQLVEQAIAGAQFARDDLTRVEVLFDHGRARDQAMLVADGADDVDDALLLGNGAPLCVRHTILIGIVLHGGNELGGHLPAIVGLAQDQLDVVRFGHLHERLQRRVVIATQSASRRRQQEHPALQQFKHCIGRLALAAP
jgi:hypothetical protein